MTEAARRFDRSHDLGDHAAFLIALASLSLDELSEYNIQRVKSYAERHPA